MLQIFNSLQEIRNFGSASITPQEIYKIFERRGAVATKITRERYQHGSIRRVKRASGFAWEFRYYVVEDDKRTDKTQTLDGATYKTEKAVRRKIEGQLLKLNEGTEYAHRNDVTFKTLLERYIEEEIPERHTTKSGYTSIINMYLRPRWEDK
ncbi:hypothetical protein [Granulicella sp. L60]|uniref:hypothetical protein n=1 Tax=Granulicella sp. L60 TaxID=1641866 RepID=UPI00131A6111|nr:hypothetical protein [Granulicella sp. L60]